MKGEGRGAKKEERLFNGKTKVFNASSSLGQVTAEHREENHKETKKKRQHNPILKMFTMFPRLCFGDSLCKTVL